jgi:hypothetical protein
MANPKDILKKGVAGQDCSKMCELVMRAFTTRNLLHFAHLTTKSFAAHKALGELYEGIVEKVDDIAEVYQGQHGILKGLSQPYSGLPDCICEHVKAEAEWMCNNKAAIASGSQPVINMLDDLESMYLKTIYQLENLS